MVRVPWNMADYLIEKKESDLIGQAGSQTRHSGTTISICVKSSGMCFSKKLCGKEEMERTMSSFDSKYLMRSNEFHFPGKQNSLAFTLTVITSEEVRRIYR